MANSILDRKGIVVTSGFKYIAKEPLDPRYVVTDEEELQSIIDNGGAYEGLEVWVKSLAKKKIYNGSEFVEITSGSSTNNDITFYEDMPQSIAIKLASIDFTQNIASSEELTDEEANYLIEKARNNITLKLTLGNDSMFVRPKNIVNENAFDTIIYYENPLNIDKRLVFYLNIKRIVAYVSSGYIRIDDLAQLIDGSVTSVNILPEYIEEIYTILRNYGKIIPIIFLYNGYDYVAHMTRYNDRTTTAFQFEARVENRLLLFNIVLTTISGTGYYVITMEEI